MHIVHCIDTLAPGGIIAVLEALIIAMPTHRHSVIYLHDGSQQKRLKNAGATLHHLPSRFTRYAPEYVITFPQMIRHLQADVIHTTLPTMMLYALLTKKHGVPVVCSIHGDLSHAGRFHRLGYYYLAHRAHQYITVSSTTKRDLCALASRKKRAPITIINNGLDCAGFKIRASQKISRHSLGLCQDAFVIGSVGRLAQQKSYDVLLNAFALLTQRIHTKKLILCIVGDGPLKNSLSGKRMNLALHPQ